MLELTTLTSILTLTTYFESTRIDEVLGKVEGQWDLENSTKKDIQYYNIPCSFDIETTSFTDEKKRDTGIMYEWTLGIGGYCIIGRTWDEFVYCIDRIVERFRTDLHNRILIYVHNLAWEFQFMRKYFKWIEVFALSPRTPVYATIDKGIEFRCSYILTGCKLAKTAENLTMFSLKKLVGELDYTKIRHSGTPLEDSEIQYCLNDVKIVMALIYERMTLAGGIRKIPLTKTGYVRAYIRSACFEGLHAEKTHNDRKIYMDFISQLTLKPDEYLLLKRGFTGGFTHANPFAVGKVWDNVRSYDFTSSYPTVMIAEQYPMSKGENIRIYTVDELKKNCKLYSCIFDIAFKNVRPKIFFENYLSYSRCRNIVSPIVNNGRVVSADQLVTTMTDIDFEIFNEMYDYDEVLIGNFYRYKRGYLPKSIIEAVLKIYNDKTKFKDVAGKEIEYALAKENLNSCYGMIVTDIIRPELPYDEEWGAPIPQDITSKLSEYNRNRSRFLFYPWGVWVTAYARRNLFSGILEFKGDYLYSDTDSIKVKNWQDHLDYLKGYNENIVAKLYRTLDKYELDRELIHPKTIEGKIKTLGLWDLDGEYKRFKTLGAKRYMYENDKGLNITIAGLNKKEAIPFMKANWQDPFESFKDGMKIDGEYTGVLTHKYIDDERSGILTDYLGNSIEYTVLSGIHLSPSDYTLGLTEQFVNYILKINTIYQ